MKKFFYFSLTSILFLILFSLSTKKIYASVLFLDNFDSGDLSQWEIINGNWLVQDILSSNRVGYNSPNQTDSEIQAGNFDWTDYSFSLDMLPVSGTDKNIFFRVSNQRSPSSGRDLPVSYGLHITKNLLELQKFTTVTGFVLDFKNIVFPVNSVTKITIEVKGREIKVFLNNSITPEIDYVDNDNFYEKGRIALGIITGADSSEVWYDNVLVEDLSPSLPPAPIVFLPGLGGSFNFKEMFLGIDNPGGWKITPGANVYKNLLETFKDQDYFYIFYYDWRLPVLENAQKLNQFITEVIIYEKLKMD